LPPASAERGSATHARHLDSLPAGPLIDLLVARQGRADQFHTCPDPVGKLLAYLF